MSWRSICEGAFDGLKGARQSGIRWWAGPSLAAALAAIVAVPARGGGDCTGFPCGHNGNKVLICHVPPDNPDDRHTICISPSAVPAHLANHPDHCGECGLGEVAYAGDIDSDGLVGVSDLLELLRSWGNCPGETCPADLDADGGVGASDFLEVLLNWD